MGAHLSRKKWSRHFSKQRCHMRMRTSLIVYILKILAWSTSSFILLEELSLACISSFYFIAYTSASFLWDSFSLVLSCKHFPFVLSHSNFNAMVHSIFYHFDNCFLHSIHLCFSFFLTSLLSIPNSVAMSPFDINCVLQIPSVSLFDTAPFKAKVNFCALSVKCFLQ